MSDIRVVAIGAIMVIECVALLCHTDGALFTLAVALVGGIAGYSVGFETCIKVVKKE